jgi:hypothetical protein
MPAASWVAFGGVETNFRTITGAWTALGALRFRTGMLVAVAVLGVAGVRPVGANATAVPTHARIGFSDQDPATFSNPYLGLLKQALRSEHARLIVAYDDPASARSWVARAEAAGLSAYVTFGGDNSCNNPVGVVPATGNCPPPTDSAYRTAFAAMITANPSVHDWGAWSEPSNYVYYPCGTPRGQPAPPAGGCASARMTARQAAGYWKDAQATDRQLGRRDTIGAGETGADCTGPSYNLCTPDNGRTWRGYVPDYLAALSDDRPPVWATHSYHDLQRRPALAATETNHFIQFLNSRLGAPPVWLTEEGAWLEGIYGALLNGNAAAQRSAATEFLELPLVPAAKPGQIAREYYYLLQAQLRNGFDSALLDVNGKPRPAYCVFSGQPASACPGDPTDINALSLVAPLGAGAVGALDPF